MRELTGNIWDYFGKPGFVVVVTTNGMVKKDGSCVMGRGVAAQARARFRAIDKELGKKITQEGNVIHWLCRDKILSFPVKHKFWEKADLELIRQSTSQLATEAKCNPQRTFILPRPGCKNGKRNWYREVKPILEAAKLPENVWVVDLEEE